MTKTWVLIFVAIAMLIGTTAYASKEKVWGRAGATCVWGKICGKSATSSSGIGSATASGSSLWDTMTWDTGTWG